MKIYSSISSASKITVIAFLLFSLCLTAHAQTFNTAKKPKLWSYEASRSDFKNNNTAIRFNTESSNPKAFIVKKVKNGATGISKRTFLAQGKGLNSVLVLTFKGNAANGSAIRARGVLSTIESASSVSYNDSGEIFIRTAGPLHLALYQGNRFLGVANKSAVAISLNYKTNLPQINSFQAKIYPLSKFPQFKLNSAKTGVIVDKNNAPLSFSGFIIPDLNSVSFSGKFEVFESFFRSEFLVAPARFKINIITGNETRQMNAYLYHSPYDLRAGLNIKLGNLLKSILKAKTTP
ncbi:MAG: hypothetical protein IT292_08005 [Deltaproteobacteria bacterium]|nr:hypothetical protein [Deltaproteobacteria bacterium]